MNKSVEQKLLKEVLKKFTKLTEVFGSVNFVVPTTTTTTSSTSTTTTTVAPQNLFLWSNKFDEYLIWNQFGTVYVPTQEPDSSWIMTFSAPGGKYQIVNVTPGEQYTFSLEIKSATIPFNLRIETLAAVVIVDTDISAQVNGTSFTRISVTGTAPLGVTQLAFTFWSTSVAGTINCQKAQLNTGPTVKPYIETTS